MMLLVCKVVNLSILLTNVFWQWQDIMYYLEKKAKAILVHVFNWINAEFWTQRASCNKYKGAQQKSGLFISVNKLDFKVKSETHFCRNIRHKVKCSKSPDVLRDSLDLQSYFKINKILIPNLKTVKLSLSCQLVKHVSLVNLSTRLHEAWFCQMLALCKGVRNRK